MLEQTEDGGDKSVSASVADTKLEETFASEVVAISTRPRCKYCAQSFATNGTLKIHVRDQHGEKLCELKHIPCLEHGCEFMGRYIDDLIKHLQGQHGKQFTVEHRTFQSLEEFDSWKKSEENTTHFSYLSISGRHRLAHGDERVYFVCSLSDYFRPRGKRNRRFDGESRSAYCTSKMVFTITPVGTGFRYAVAYTKDHYGHINTGSTNSIGNTRSSIRGLHLDSLNAPVNAASSFASLGSLSETERALIALLLERGISPNTIVDQLRTAGASNACTSARFGLATANDVRAALRKEVGTAQRALESCTDERALLSALADLKRAARTLLTNWPEPRVNALSEQAVVAASSGAAQRNGSKRKPRTTKARRLDATAVNTDSTAGANPSNQAVSAASSSGTASVSMATPSCASSANLHLSNLMPPTQIQIGSSAYYGAPYHSHAPAGTINWTDFMNI